MVTPLVLGGMLAVVAVLYDPTVAERITSRVSLDNVQARQDLLDLARAGIGERWWLGAGGGVGEDVHNTYVQQLVYFGVGMGIMSALVIAQAARSVLRLGELGRAGGAGIVVALISFLGESSLEGTLLRPLLFLTFALVTAAALAEVRLRGADPAHVEERPWRVGPIRGGCPDRAGWRGQRVR